MQIVLFACVHNAGRSQMAAAFFNEFADPERARAISAGTEPADRVHPEVLQAMLEAGLDVSTAEPQLLTEALAQRASLLVTMGCGEKCPYVPGLRRDDWLLRDPKGLSLEEVRKVRDEVQDRVTTDPRRAAEMNSEPVQIADCPVCPSCVYTKIHAESRHHLQAAEA